MKMISTKKMEKIASYNYFGVAEVAFRNKGKYFFSVIDHRTCDMRLDGIYDELGVYRVNQAYIQKWAETRGIKIA